MENVSHLWNVIKFLTKFDEKRVNQLRSYYVQCCQQQGQNVELPKQVFGASTMCSHCGSLWTKVKHRNRLISGKTCSNSVKKIIHTAENGGRLSRYRSTLMRKSLRDNMNKMIVKCSACLQNTKIPLNKPKRLKPKRRQETLNELEAQKSNKKKKRRSKDKMAGLNISLSSSYVTTPTKTESPKVYKSSTPLSCRGKKEGKPMTPFEKLRKINKDKLNSILKDDGVKKKRSLNIFLEELY